MSKGKIFDIGQGKNQGQGEQPPQPKQLTRQDVMDAPDVGCQRCGGELFLPAIRFKRISKLLTGESHDQLVDMNTFVCAKCGLELGKQFDEMETEDGGNEPTDPSDDTPETSFDE